MVSLRQGKARFVAPRGSHRYFDFFTSIFTSRFPLIPFLLSLALLTVLPACGGGGGSGGGGSTPTTEPSTERVYVGSTLPNTEELPDDETPPDDPPDDPPDETPDPTGGSGIPDPNKPKETVEEEKEEEVTVTDDNGNTDNNEEEDFILTLVSETKPTQTHHR